MENLVDNSIGGNEFGLNDQAVAHLNETRKWTMFMSILGLVFLAIMFIGMFAMNALMSGVLGMYGMSDTQGSSAMPGVIMIVVLLVFMVIYFFPIYYLLQFSLQSKKAIETRDSQTLQNALRYLKMHYKYIGILMIIFISIYLLAGIIALLARWVYIKI